MDLSKPSIWNFLFGIDRESCQSVQPIEPVEMVEAIKPLETVEIPKAKLNSAFMQLDAVLNPELDPPTLPSVSALIKETTEAKETEPTDSQFDCRSKRNNTSRFTEKQLEALEASYQVNRMPSLDDKAELAKKLDLSIVQIDNWFCLTRYRRKIVFTKEQREVLECIFQKNMSPGPKKKDAIAAEFKVIRRHVDNWFCNRRKQYKDSRHRKVSELKEALWRNHSIKID